MNIDKLQPGRELDVLIDEYMFNHKPQWSTNEEDDELIYLPKYSTDIGAAWAIICLFPEYDLYRVNDDETGEPMGVGCELCDGKTTHSAGAETEPLAICRAALRFKI